LLTVDFIALLAKLLRTNGNLYMATDVRVYADWVLENAAQVPLLRNMGAPFADSSAIENYVTTFFEAKWREEGRTIYYLWYRREQP
jgi:tRNA G46 methylase TrmB